MKIMLKNPWNWLVSFLPRKPSVVVPEHRRRAELKMRKSIWVFYESKYGIDPDKDKTIREFIGEDEWYGSGIATGGDGERDNSFYWSVEIEARATHLKATGIISRIQIFEPARQVA